MEYFIACVRDFCGGIPIKSNQRSLSKAPNHLGPEIEEGLTWVID
jgi:hypothetical protein